MNFQEKSGLIARVISGEFYCRLSDKLYVIRHPSRMVRYMAQEIYNDILYESRFQEWLDEKAVNTVLVDNELIDKNNETNTKAIEKRVEDLQIDLYGALFSQEKQKPIRKELERTRVKQNEMYAAKHMFDSVTPEGYAASIRDEYILINTVYWNDERLWPDPLTADFTLLDAIVSCVNKRNITITEFRELARTEPWRSYWSIGKSEVFDNAIADWTDEQRTLAMFSRMYDSIFESSEFPGDAVIIDDDMLDGWLALQRRERDQQLNDNNVEKLLLKGAGHEGHGEIFIPVSNREEADRINNMNDMNARMIKKQREAQMKAQGGVHHGQLKDQKLELRQMALEQYKQTLKGKG